MPRLLLSIEDLSIARKSDIFYLAFSDLLYRIEGREFPEGYDIIVSWFIRNFGEKNFEQVYSVKINHEALDVGFGNIFAVLPMTNNEINNYSAAWELNDDGFSSDQRWQAYIFKYKE